MGAFSNRFNKEINTHFKGATPPRSSINTEDVQELRLVLKWPGDNFATQHDLKNRNKIENLIVKRDVGLITRVGTGMGWMDIELKVDNKNEAQIALEEIMREVDPIMKFQIE